MHPVEKIEKMFIKMNPTIAWEEKSDFTYFAIYWNYIFRYEPVKRMLTIQYASSRSSIIDIQDSKEFSETMRQGAANFKRSIYAVYGCRDQHNDVTYEFRELIKDL